MSENLRHSEIPPIESARDTEPQHPTEAEVSEAVESLHIGLDLEKHPHLLERFTEISTHFDDNVDIAKIAGALFPDFKEALHLTDETPERLQRAGLLTDIGKSGPAGEEGPFHDAVQKLFIVPTKPFNAFKPDGSMKTIADFLEETGMEGAEGIVAALAEKGIFAKDEKMLDFWRRHAEWTLDILKQEASNDIDPVVITAAASHHLLDGKNPAGLDLNGLAENSPDIEEFAYAEILQVIDKYQAFRGRGGMSHAEAVSRTRAKVESAPGYPPVLRSLFTKALAVIEAHQAEMDALLAHDEAAPSKAA
ncbi:MAG: hypothetical protein RLZZ324_899 [Candidatus Parcubacteria bacterium]|jgi:hypothetical protein